MGCAEVGTRREENPTVRATFGFAQSVPVSDAQHTAMASIYSPNLQSLLCKANTTSSESDLEAQNSVIVLQHKVQKLVEQNEALFQRLDQYSVLVETTDRSTRIPGDDGSTLRVQDARAESHTPNFSRPLRQTSKEPESMEAALNTNVPLQDFEIALEQTYVYRRVQSNNDSDVSFTTSTFRLNAWRLLSDLSLDDISMVSVIALPISFEEINSIGPNLTFANIISGVERQNDTDAISEHCSVMDNEPVSVQQRSSPWIKYGFNERRFLRTDGRENTKNSAAKQRLPDRATRSENWKNWKMPACKIVVMGDSDIEKTALCIKVCSTEYSLVLCSLMESAVLFQPGS